MKSFFRDLLKFLEIDQAIFFGLLTRVWGIIVGPVSLILMGIFFTPQVQGYYYTFGSLMALQVFVELGLSQVIVQFASHEWSKLRFEDQRVSGDPIALSRLASLGRFMFCWYAVAGLLVVAAIGPGGYWFFSKAKDPQIVWFWPWTALCVFAGFKMALSPAFALLEGCGQIKKVYGFRFFEGIVLNISNWLTILSGAGLWTVAVSVLVSVTCSVMYLWYEYRGFFGIFLTASGGAHISWRFEIWPFQWKVAVSWLCGYFAFSLFTPVLFHYSGAVVAGQMGMTWQMLMMATGISSMWVATKVPTFGALIAQRDYAALDRLFFRSAAVTIAIACAGVSGIWCFTWLLNGLGHRFAMRLLPLLPMALFCLATVLQQFSIPLAAYLRAHKKEPFLAVGITQGTLVALLTWGLGRRYGAMGVASGYLSVNAVVIPWATLIWYRCRRVWHETANLEGRYSEIYF